MIGGLSTFERILLEMFREMSVDDRIELMIVAREYRARGARQPATNLAPLPLADNVIPFPRA